jgi:phosphonate transport system substrate-binding protein
MPSRRLLLAKLLLLLGLFLSGCVDTERLVARLRYQSTLPEKLTVGLVSYEAGERSVEQYERFKDYLAEQTNTVVEIEPSFNELRALDRVRSRTWSIVFAPPGLAAVAIATEKYIPIFRMEGVYNLHSVLVVREDSPIRSLADLANKVVALGERGSAAGYYMPLYDLYGLTLAEVRFAPTPKTILAWLSQGTVAAGALSEDDFQRYRHEFDQTKFRILNTSRFVPPGVVLLGPTVDRNQEQQIKAAMSEAPSSITDDAGYIPNAQLPNYEQLIQIVEKVRPLENRLRKKPVVLTLDKNTSEATSATKARD